MGLTATLWNPLCSLLQLPPTILLLSGDILAGQPLPAPPRPPPLHLFSLYPHERQKFQAHGAAAAQVRGFDPTSVAGHPVAICCRVTGQLPFLFFATHTKETGSRLLCGGGFSLSPAASSPATASRRRRPLVRLWSRSR